MNTYSEPLCVSTVFRLIFYHLELTDEEILAHSVFFFMAGYETTSGSLAWVLYELSRHPDIQDRLLKEINDVMQDNVRVTY